MGEGIYSASVGLGSIGIGSYSFDVPGITLLVSTDGGATWSYDAKVASEMAGQLPQAFIGIIESAFFSEFASMSGASTSSSALNIFSYGALAGQAFLGLTGAPGTIRCTTTSSCYIVTLPNSNVLGTQSSSSGIPQVLASTILSTNDSGATFKVQSSIEDIVSQSSSVASTYYDNGVPVSSPPAFPSSSVSISCVDSSTCVVGGTDSNTASIYATTSSGWTSPVLSQAFPPQASLTGATISDLTGSGLDGPSSAITVGASSATEINCESENICAVSVPASTSPGPVSVGISTSIGTNSVADAITYISAPTVSSITPAEGSINGGTYVTITGTNFHPNTGTIFSFGGILTSGFSSNTQCSSDTTCALYTPEGKIQGPVDVQAITLGGASPATSAVSFDYIQLPPQVTGVYPVAGGISGGETVRIYGNYFQGATAVYFGSIEATSFSVVSGTEIEAVDPANPTATTSSPVTVDVTVTTPSGTSPTTSSDQFTYEGLPSITSAVVSANGTVLITGNNLLGAYEVSFDGESKYYISADTSTELVTTLPNGLSGKISVTVTTLVGTSPVSYFGGLPPKISYVSPIAGGTSGGEQVTIDGSYFQGATAVYFGSIEATSFSVVSGTEIEAVDPAEQAGTVDITVTTPSGTSPTSSSDQFTYEAPPVITSITVASSEDPNSPTGVDATVTIQGENLTGATSATFNGITVPIQDSPTEVQVMLPQGLEGTITASVTTPAGTSAPSSAAQFSYFPPPVITCFSPTSGPASGGTVVYVTGLNFEDEGSSAVSSVYFDSVAAPSFTVNSAAAITAISPAHTPASVAIVIHGPYGQSLTEISPSCLLPPSAPFTSQPVAASGPVTPVGVSYAGNSIGATPTSSFCGGETPIVITGSNLSSITGVSFGTLAASSFAVVGSMLVACIPSGVSTNTLTLITPQGPITLKFTYVPNAPPCGTPFVNHIYPAEGSPNGGTKVTITGHNLGTPGCGAPSVYFGANAASSITRVSANELVAVSPPGHGIVDVTVSTLLYTSATTSADRFTYLPRIVEFIHGINGNYTQFQCNNLKGGFQAILSKICANRTDFTPQSFAYYQDIGYKLPHSSSCNVSLNQPDTNTGVLYVNPNSINEHICDSKGAVGYSSAALDKKLSEFATKHPNRPVTVMANSMGAAITRGWMTLAQTNGPGDKSLETVDSVIFLEGAQAGSYLAGFFEGLSMATLYEGLGLPVVSPPAGATALVLHEILIEVSKLLNLDMNRPGVWDMVPAWNWYQSVNPLPPPDLAYYNFYGNVRLHLYAKLLWTTIPGNNITLHLGDGVMLTGSNNPTAMPPWGGAKFLPGGSETSSIHQFSMGNYISINRANPATWGRILQLFSSPVWHIRFPNKVASVKVNSCEAGQGKIAVPDQVMEILNNPEEGCS